MGRKKNNTSGTDVDAKQSTPLAQRLSTLITDTNELKEYLGCSIQAINQYKLGISRPSLENLCKIADFYGVSTDYLLGRTETRSPNATIQAVCEYTGLSESAISCLHSAKLQNQNLRQNPMHARIHAPWEPDNLDMLSYLLTNRKFFIGVLDKFIELGVCAVSLLKPIHLLAPEEFRDIPKDHVLLTGVEYFDYLRYELLHYIEQIIDRFTSEIRDANNANMDDEGGSDNGFNQETD